jgi:hypothetical protein
MSTDETRPVPPPAPPPTAVQQAPEQHTDDTLVVEALPPTQIGTAVWWRNFLWIAGAAISFAAASVWYAAVRDREPGAIYAVLLLLISTALLIAGSLKATPPWWVVIISAALEIWKATLLLVYTNTNRWHVLSEVMSQIAVAISCLTLVAILVMARLIIDKPGTQQAVRKHLFATICAALYLFSHIAYDLTFALALEDRCGEGRALQYNGKALHAERFVLHFRARAAGLDTAVALSKMVRLWPASEEEKLDAVRKEFPELHEDTIRDVTWNAMVWKEIADHVERHKRTEWWRVTIVGHATDALAITDGQQKNDLLSQERVDETYRNLRNALPRDDTRIEWVLRSVSSDDNEAHGQDYQPGRDHKGTADVIIESSRPFELLDYGYFMTYTITTTGYGDIIPLTPRAKFVTAVANIFEVMFIVVLFNLVFVYAKRE